MAGHSLGGPTAELIRLAVNLTGRRFALAEAPRRTNSRTRVHPLPARSACGEISRIISFA
jgi:hypothetical protein